jgi:hypothetical protein
VCPAASDDLALLKLLSSVCRLRRKNAKSSRQLSIAIRLSGSHQKASRPLNILKPQLIAGEPVLGNYSLAILNDLIGR